MTPTLQPPYITTADGQRRVTPSMLVDYVRTSDGAAVFRQGKGRRGFELTEIGQNASEAVRCVQPSRISLTELFLGI